MKYYLVYNEGHLNYSIVREDQYRTLFCTSIQDLLSDSPEFVFYNPERLGTYFCIDPETDLLTSIVPNRDFQLLATFNQLPTFEVFQSNYPELLL